MPRATMEEEHPYKFEEDFPYRVKLVSVEERRKHGTSQRTGKDYDFTVWLWKFEVAEGEQTGDWAWGESEDRLTTHPSNKVRKWGEALRGEEFAIGEGIDTDDLLGLECLMTFKHRTYESKGETQYVCDIDEVYPLDAMDGQEPPF